jgi:hypothetical protein
MDMEGASSPEILLIIFENAFYAEQKTPFFPELLVITL